MNFQKKYIKYKNRYLELKKQIGGEISAKYCSNKLNELKQQIIKLANINGIKDDNLGEYVDDWFNNKIDDKSPLKKLLDPLDSTITKPLWWSGFNLEDKNIKQSFDKQVKELDAYAASDTQVSNILTNNITYSNLKEHCNINTNLQNVERMISSFFTLNGLEKLSKTLNLTVLLNKGTNESDEYRLQKSYFYNTEVKVIIQFCIKNEKNCNIHIWNLKPNCDDIGRILKEYIEGVINEMMKSNTEYKYRPTINIICKHIEQSDASKK